MYGSALGLTHALALASLPALLPFSALGMAGAATRGGTGLAFGGTGMARGPLFGSGLIRATAGGRGWRGGSGKMLFL